MWTVFWIHRMHLSSWRDREKRLEILKDSHAGAFAVITACVYFYGYVWWNESDYRDRIDQKILYILVARICGFQMLCRELVLLHLPKANASGTVAEFSRKAQDTRVRNILITLSYYCWQDLLLWIQPVWGAAVFITALLVFCFYRYKAHEIFWRNDRRSFRIFSVSL